MAVLQNPTVYGAHQDTKPWLAKYALHAKVSCTGLHPSFSPSGSCRGKFTEWSKSWFPCALPSPTPPTPRKPNRASLANALSHVAQCSLSPQPFSHLRLFYLSAKCDLGKSRPIWESKKLLIVATPWREILGPKDGKKKKKNRQIQS